MECISLYLFFCRNVQNGTLTFVRYEMLIWQFSFLIYIGSFFALFYTDNEFWGNCL